jgi:hypothetical protein
VGDILLHAADRRDRGGPAAQGSVGVSAEKPTGWALRLIPFSVSSNGYDDTTGEPRVTSEIHRRQVVDIGNWSTAAEQRQLYELLLEMEWLPPALRRVIMAELNLSPRHQNRRIEEARTTTLRFLIEERKQAMRAQGRRPRGGVHEAAVAEIADQQSMTVPALKQRLRRLNQRARKTGRQ